MRLFAREADKIDAFIVENQRTFFVIIRCRAGRPAIGPYARNALTAKATTWIGANSTARIGLTHD
jgi:hypothetical protein